MRKSLEKPWDMGNKIGGYFNDKKDYDVMFFGTSHSYCSVVPKILIENGTKSYILASQKQPIEANYFYIREALKRSHPKIIYLDSFDVISKSKLDEATVHSYTDYFPFGISKLQLIKDAVPSGMKLHTAFPLLMYHSRWDELKKEDFKFKYGDYHDENNGYVELTGQSPSFKKDKSMKKENLNSIEEADNKYIDEKFKTILKINKICKINGAKLIVIKTPLYHESFYRENLNYLKDLARKNDIEFFDFNPLKREIGLTVDDFYDPGHLNKIGAEKFTKYFIKTFKAQ